jgi:hypothetical protein
VRLVLTLLVRDERDVIEENLGFHLECGVEFVIATDHGSTDGTEEVLRRYERRGVLRLLHAGGEPFAQERLVTRMARLAAVEHDADWLVHCDADEFWWTEGGDLKAVLAGVPDEVGVVLAQRTNFRPAPGSAGRPFHERMVVRELESRNPLGRLLPPKVAHRATPDAVLAPGNHGLVAPALAATHDAPVEVLHFPVRSYEQLRRKVVQGTAALERDTGRAPSAGSHWRHLHELERQGQLRAWYDGQLADPGEVEGDGAQGLVLDRRLQRFFAERPSAGEPSGRAPAA